MADEVETGKGKPKKDQDPLEALEALEAEAPDADDDGEKPKPDLEVRGRGFDLVAELPGIVTLRLSAASDPKTPPARQMTAILSFLQSAVVRDQREDFLAWLEDADPAIGLDELNDLLTKATEVIAARPTQQ